MRHSRLAPAFVSLLLLIGAASPAASFEFYSVSTGLRDATDCRVAAADQFAVVGWVEADSVWTRRWAGGALEPAVNHGPGSLPDVAYAERPILAFVRDGAIVVREHGAEGWADAMVYAFALDVTLPRLTRGAAGGTYLCFQTDYGTVRFAGRIQGEWQEAENVLDDLPVAIPHFAQAVPVPDGESWRPRVYAMTEMDLVYSERVGGVWQTPVGIHPDEFTYGGEFAVAGAADNGQHVLSNGPQPTCPCNVIHYTHGGLTGPWSDPEHLTVEFDYYTWPQDPAIAVDVAGRVHAVWFEQHYSMLMVPTWRALFYQVRAGGVWTDYSESFCCMRGKDADMDLRDDDSPAIVFTQAHESPSQVVLAMDSPAVGVENAPAAGLTLSAQPNPFNPRTSLSLAIPAPAIVELAICDVSGRRVRNLLAGPLPAGLHRLDWDGRDERGRELPSGVYVARVAGGAQRAVIKLVLLR